MMNQCEFCGAGIDEAAGFCGTCGRVPSQIAQRVTRLSDLSTFQLGQRPDQGNDNRTILSAWEKDAPSRTPSGSLHPVTLLPIEKNNNNDDDDDDERRRGVAFLGMALPLAGEIANYPTAGLAPTLQGTPPIAHMPTIAGTPPIAHMPTIAGTPPISPAGPGLPLIQGNPPALPHVQPPQPLPPPPVRQPGGQPGGQPGNSPGSTPHNPGGCLPLSMIISLATILVILAVSAGLGLTVFAPGLSLNGNTTVTPGDNLIVHGHNFFPNSSVTLTLDGNTPLYFSQSQHPTRLAGQFTGRVPVAGLVLSPFLSTAARNDIPTHSDGTFTATVPILSTWTAGGHTIHATEAVSHRSASLSFKIAQTNSAPTATTDTSPTPGTTPTGTPTASPTPGTTPTGTPTASPTPGTTPTATPTASPTPAPPRLSCANPGNLALGSVGEFTSQTVSAGVTLCTTGSGTLNWKASWDQNQASWLQISQNSGSVQAPNQVQLTISASAANLGAGTYTATVTFLGVESNTSQTINVTLQVQAGCINSSSSSLSFTGTEGLQDPAGQTITLTNCGLDGQWSATIKNGSNWLSLDSNQGTLAAGATRTITVTASNVATKLKAGTYKDSITFTIGSNTTTVSVLLTVNSPQITISANPTALDSASSPCKSGDSSVCVITLTNTSSVTASWSASPSSKGVNVQAASTTIPAGGTEQVTIVVALGNCGTQVTIAFTAQGGNTVTVTWKCTLQTPSIL